MDGAQLGLLVGMLLLVTAVVVLLLLVLRRVSARRTEEAEREAQEILARATAEARSIIDNARDHARETAADADRRIAQQLAGLDEARDGLVEHRQEVRDELSRLRTEQREREHRLGERENRLNRDHNDLADRAARLQDVREALDARDRSLNEAEGARRIELERVAALTAEQARAELLQEAEHEARKRAAVLARDIEREARRNAQHQARLILVGAIERMAGTQTTESTVSSVALPSEDMKGRIIGREGRNIRAFEQVTGANLVVDDTPDLVLVSCFDPVRREVARLALTELVTDGRIHPTSIEEAHARSLDLVADRCQEAADEALLEVGITDLAPELVETLGVLRYRTSYGQNVLKHLVECAHLARMIAAELGLDPGPASRAAFLHDIGKALTHEAEGSHALVGADLARRHGEHPDVVHAIEAHHNEVEPQTAEAHLVQVVDAISGARPGARRESVDQFMKRMSELEKLARGHRGVDKVFAMQAGRDVRVMVKPDLVDDLESQVLARTIAKQFEEELTYPGQIKVTVVRESRATETAR